MPLRDFLWELKEVGLGTLPGTADEISQTAGLLQLGAQRVELSLRGFRERVGPVAIPAVERLRVDLPPLRAALDAALAAKLSNGW